VQRSSDEGGVSCEQLRTANQHLQQAIPYTSASACKVISTHIESRRSLLRLLMRVM
jgi:hypothetical protein